MRILSRVKSASTRTQNGYLPIRIGSLRVDTITGFDVFIGTGPDESPVLFSDRNLPLTEGRLERLRETGQERIYVSTAQEKEYHRYIEEHLESILSDTTVAVAERSEVLYESAQHHLQEVFASPRSPELLARSKALVRSSCEFLIKERSAFEYLLSIISYDYHTYTHSVSTFVYGFSLAQSAGFNDPQVLYDFGEGALLHDIGKSMIDPTITRSKERLSVEQWAQMRMHPLFGHEILKDCGKVGPIGMDVIRHHHEKLNGGGYPDGLRGDAIQPMVRLFTIVDIFDALSTQRPYKSALPTFAALKLMREEMTEDLDQEYFCLFVKLMGSPGGVNAVKQAEGAGAASGH